MSDLTAPVGGAGSVESVPAVNPASNSSDFSLDPREAARQLSNHRWKRDNPEEAAKEAKETSAEPSAPETATEPNELAETPTDDQPQADPVETTQEAEPEATLPPIEPPRSWTKDEKEEFATYPREAQEKIARREQERETALRRSQNEAADKLKGLTAQQQAVEQARQQYEAALPRILSALKDAQAGQFADIKTPADAMALAQNDPARYVQYRAQQDIIAQAETETRAAQERQVNEFKTKWSEYATKQDQLLVEHAPELADKTRATKIADAAVGVLKDIGFNDQELAQLWNGEASVSLRDHRLQLLILDGVKYREAKAGAAKPAAKPIPPVQKPGVSKAPKSAGDAEVETLEKRFERTGDPKDGAKLLIARRKASA